MAQEGLFSGIDTRSQAELLQERARARAREFQQLGPQGGLMSQQMLRNAGGMLVNALRKDTLPTSQQNQVNAVTAAKTRLDEWRRQNPDATVEDQGLASQRYLAEELLKVGDPNGMQLAQTYAQQQVAKRKADAEFEGMQAETAERKARTDNINWDTQTGKLLAGKGRVAQAWDVGAQYGDTGYTGFIDDAGNLHKKDLMGNEEIIPLGQYTIHAPARGFKDWTINDLGIPDSDAREIRQTATAVMKEAADAMNMADILIESVGEDSQLNWLAESGSAQSFVMKWADNLSSFARSFDPEGSLTVDGVDMESAAAREKWWRDNPEAESALPPQFRGNSEYAIRWRAAISRAAYSAARAEEPGARNVTDNDYTNAVVGLAGVVTDPEAFRRVTLERVNSHINSFEDRLAFYAPEVQEKIMARAGVTRYKQRVTDFRAKYANAFGQANAPGPGLRPATEEVYEVDF